MPDRGHILIVDDDAASTVILQALLEKDGYSVDSANGRDDAVGVVTVAETKPNLVLLNAQLANDDPFELRDLLKKSPQVLDVPVIFMTGHDDAAARVKSLERGDDVVSKPFDAHEILTRVERQVTVSKVRMALRESEAKFRSVMESAIDAIISGDSTGVIRAWNSAATALFGFTEEEAVGRPIDLIIPERYRQAHRTGVRRVSGGGLSHVIGKTVELAAIRKDGTEFPVELSLATWFLDDDRYYTGIIRDISERKQAEQKFRSVTESAIDAIISADHEGEIVSWNKAATTILGYTEKEAVGQPLELIIPERFHAPHRAGMGRVASGGKGRVIGTTVELFARTKGGKEVPIELSLSTWTVRDQRFFTGIIRDIRERKQAEEALRRSEQALRARTLELNNKNQELEEALSRLHETQNQLIVQEKMASLGKLSAGMAHELNNPAAAAQRGAAQLQEAFAHAQKVQNQMDMLQLDQAQLDRLVALDQMAREQAQQPEILSALDRSDREAALESWLGDRGIEHGWELAPSLVALGFDPAAVEDLAAGFTPGQLPTVLDWLSCIHSIHRLIAEINLGTRRIVELVKALKTYTYMDRAPIQSVDVRQGIENTLIILHNKLKAGVTVHREYVEELPRIQASGSELNQVWTNLIDNSIDAMEGSGNLTIRLRSDQKCVLVEIEDDGPGIPSEIQSKIFDPFFTTKPPGQGTGLGLNISRNIVVQKMRGHIELESQPGRTRFTVYIPIEISPDEEPCGEEKESDGQADHHDAR